MHTPSIVQGLLSAQLILVPTQLPLPQTSPVVHTLLSSHAAVVAVQGYWPPTGAYRQPLASQLSAVHRLPSLQSSPLPLHTPSLPQLSPWVQPLPSSQAPPWTAGCTQPLPSMQTSAVHAEPSSHSPGQNLHAGSTGQSTAHLAGDSLRPAQRLQISSPQKPQSSGHSPGDSPFSQVQLPQEGAQSCGHFIGPPSPGSQTWLPPTCLAQSAAQVEGDSPLSHSWFPQAVPQSAGQCLGPPTLSSPHS